MKEALPIDAVLPELLGELRRGPAVVLEAPPGAGKTTRVPPALLGELPGDVVVLEPRRIAARTAARRVAWELGEKAGETVGYQIRFEDVSSAKTRIRYVTEGILARRLLGDPELKGVSAVVLDEFHERHLPADLSLALTLRLMRKRRDLKLVVMSATLDAQGIASYLQAPIVRSEGRRFDVAIEHLEKPDERRIGEQVAAAVRKLTVPGTEGHVLVFLPGLAEIRYAAEALDELAKARGLLVLPLHGDLSGDEQDRALAPSKQRKVILATNVAETSVTVEGVTAVVDTGLARIASHSQWSGLSSLQIGKISKASATQRAGRAGRTAPGRALRLYTKHDFDSRPEQHPPEIERLDLAATVLELRAAGLEPGSLPWLDEPPPGALNAAEDLLKRIGAVDASGRVTGIGRACARLPVHPRLARIAVEAAERGFAQDGCAIAAALSEGIRLREQLPTGPSDVLELAPRADKRLTKQLQNALRIEKPRRGVYEQALLEAILAGFPDRVARRRAPGSSEVLLAAGGSAQLARESSVRDAQLMVAVDAEERREAGRSKALVRLASAIEPEWLLDLFAERLRETVELVWEPSRERVEAITRMLYDELVLEESRRPPRDEELREAARILAQHARLDQEALASLKARTALVAQHCPEAGLEPLTDDNVQAALARACEGATSLAELPATPPLLDSRQSALLDKLAPEHVMLPGGRRVRVEYTAGQPPAARSRLQDFFGMARTPAICNGRVPLTLHLLAPSGRAQQVTQDLAGFWRNHYPAIRRELMRRYPRHAWPEDGATATPPPQRRH